ncbi:MAG: transporter substrate-binding domain-containing protein [Clostridia bacterium]|nr:transporter substrate-binding domain-containing protein [Clostridia bacterium]
MKESFSRRLRRRAKRLQLNFKRVNFTLIGDEGRPWRRAIAFGAGLLAVIILLLVGGTETQLMATPEVKTIEERGVLRVGIRRDMPGLNGDDGLEQALARRIAERILPETDLENSLQLVEVSTMTSSTKLDDGTVDMVIAMMSPSMAPSYYYSSSYYSDECILAVMSGTSSFALKNFTIGLIQDNALRNSAEDALVDAFVAENTSFVITKRAYPSYDDLITGLMKGEVGGVALTRLHFDQLKTQYDIVPTSLSFGTVDYCVMTASDNSILADIAGMVINDLWESGEMYELHAKYGLM